MRASSAAGGGRFVEAQWHIGEDTTAVAPRDARGSSPPPSRPGASGQAQELAAAQATAGASTAAAARALKMAQEAREVACATLNELGSQADALKSAAASLGETEAAVHASERTLDDINAGCFGCFGPKRRLARRLPKPAATGGGAWRRFWAPAGGASNGAAAATERREAPAPAEASAGGGGSRGASQRPRKAASAKSAAARARLVSSQPGAAVAGGAGSREAASRSSGGGSAFGDVVLDKEAAAQDATLSELDAAVSELAVISSRIGEELDQQARGPASAAAPVLDALHVRADELGVRFRAMNTTGQMGRIKASSASSDRKADAGSHGRKPSR